MQLVNYQTVKSTCCADSVCGCLWTQLVIFYFVPWHPSPFHRKSPWKRKKKKAWSNNARLITWLGNTMSQKTVRRADYFFWRLSFMVLYCVIQSPSLIKIAWMKSLSNSWAFKSLCQLYKSHWVKPSWRKFDFHFTSLNHLSTRVTFSLSNSVEVKQKGQKLHVMTLSA